MTTNELLRRYVTDQSEPAFAELVRQYIDLVYSAALRQINGDAAAAQDVTQAVFTELATRVSQAAIAAVAAGGGLGWGLLKLAGAIKGNLLVAVGATAIVASLLVIPQWLHQNNGTTISAQTAGEEPNDPVANAVDPASVNSATTGNKRALRILTTDPGEPTQSAQGMVNFATVPLGPSARVYDTNGTPASGPAFKAQLYAAPGTAAESVLVAVGNPVGFRSGGNAGYVQNSGTAFGKAVDPVVTIATSVAGGPVTVQLRAWDAAYATHEAALAANAQHGESDLLALGGTGIPKSTTPVDLIGLEGFKMVVSDLSQNPLTGKDPNRMPKTHTPAPTAPDDPAVQEWMRQHAGYIDGKPPELARHIAANRFLNYSNAKDTVEGQAITRLLLENGYGPEHIYPVYQAGLDNWNTYHVSIVKPNTDETKASIVKRRRASNTQEFVKGGGRMGLSPIDAQLVDKLLDITPSVVYPIAGRRPQDQDLAAPVDNRYFTGQDILDYINSHPAKP